VEGTALKPSLIPPGVPLSGCLLTPPIRGTHLEAPLLCVAQAQKCADLSTVHTPRHEQSSLHKLGVTQWVVYSPCVTRFVFRALAMQGRGPVALPARQGASCMAYGAGTGYGMGVAEGSYKRRPARSLWRPGGAGQVVAPAGAVGVAAAAGDAHTHSGTAARWIGGLVRLRKNPFRTPTLHHHPAGRSRQRTPPAHRPTPSLGQARRRLRAAADGWERCTRRRGSIPAMR